jgi:phytoene synthase
MNPPATLTRSAAVTATEALSEGPDTLHAGLQAAADRARAQGLPVPALEGKLLRPLIAYLAVPSGRRHELDERFWSGALAVQMVHEASLLHDDILDEAATRRGKATLAASKGVARALVEGDHLLTASYRMAMQVGTLPFADAFARAVERTVAGEKLQNARAGSVLSESEYVEVVDGKSGELFGCATALGACLLFDSADRGRIETARDLGVRIGRLYQRVDDFLDYCGNAQAGKAPFQDYRQRKWTWVLAFAPDLTFDLAEDALADRLFSRDEHGSSSMGRALHSLRTEAQRLATDLRAELGGSPGLDAILSGWVDLATRALAREEASASTAAEQADWLPYFARHSKTFRFAARFFPPAEERLIGGVYAFCRFTDDIVDGREDLPRYQLSSRLEAWRHLTRVAYEGQNSGVPLLDQVMGATAARGVPLDYALELIDGVGMDIRPAEYNSMDDLLVYTYRVASVVGLWVTELFGIRDPWMLERAEALGHAMQLTNILRDVGEDWRTGRIYVPMRMRARYGVDYALLDAMSRGAAPPTPGYVELLEDLMAQADRRYEFAMEAVPHLPTFFRRPVAVAARVYQGIHDRVRANGYDNMTRRAFTRPHHKLLLGLHGLWETRSGPDAPRPDSRLSGSSSPRLSLLQPPGAPGSDTASSGAGASA